jgi:hypothetical protein
VTETDKRRRVLHVVYDEQIDLPNGKASLGDSLPAGGEIVCPREKTSQSDQWDTDPNIFPEGEDIPHKREKYSPEGACFQGCNVTSVGAELAKFERRFKAGEVHTEELRAWGDYLADLHLDGDIHDPDAQRAGRLVEEVGFELMQRGAE